MAQEYPVVTLAQLTPQEKVVLGLLAKNARYREIAEKLNISMNTVRYHVRNLYKKLGVNRRSEAVERARRSGLIIDKGP